MTLLRIGLIVVLTFLSIACGGPAERIKEREKAISSPTPTPGEREIAGAFQVSGTAAGRPDPYTGALAIEPQGDLYSFRWTLSTGNRVGTAVEYGDHAAASFAPTGAGKGCGVMLYKVSGDGASLDGRSAMWGEQKFAIEKGERTEGTGFEGKYSLTGTTTDGKPYSGSLEIKKQGEGYIFLWKTDHQFGGFGIWRGSVAAVSFGGPQCSFALYDISGNTLDGFWGGQKQLSFGKETAKR
ncbi:MAG TPA: hypothetical protein VGI80_03270 [Pyrinomonadaceae bacterium]